MTEPGSQRLAVVSGYAALWLRQQVPSEQWRQQAYWLRKLGHRALADQLEVARTQLHCAAEEFRNGQAGSQATTSGIGSVPVEVARSGAPLGDELVSVREAAEMVGVTQRRVLQLLSAGRLTGRKVGGRWLVDRPSVQAWMDGAA